MVSNLVAGATRLLTGVVVRQVAAEVPSKCRVYFANHTSHLDFLVLWSVLPAAQRRRTIPVAARDYWERTALRRYLAQRVFRALLINRETAGAHDNPLTAMVAVLEAGESLILFPEGTRSLDGQVHPFKAGLYHLARRCPDVPLVPVYLANLNRVLPKGEVLPVPMMCSATFGAALQLQTAEPREAFLERARRAVEELDPHAT